MVKSQDASFTPNMVDVDRQAIQIVVTVEAKSRQRPVLTGDRSCESVLLGGTVNHEAK